MNVRDFLGHLSGVVKEGSGWKARCPVHDDHEPSLGVAEGKKGIVLNCRVGCKAEDVVTALGLEMKDLFADPPTPKREIDAVYDYKDANGKVRDQKIRYRPKSFAWRHQQKGSTVYKRSTYRGIYRLPELVATEPSTPVFVVEGEKDVDRLTSIGAVATCSPDGADSKGEPSRKWLDQYTEHFAGRTVAVISDNDEPGQAFARYVASQIASVAESVKLVEALPGVAEKGDVSDYLNVAGHDLQTLQAHIESLPAFAVEPTAAAPVYDAPLSVQQVHDTFRKWLGKSYDVAALNACLASVAAERLDGDPVWLLIVGGPGNTKTEVVTSLAGAGAIVTSTIASEGALLSGSSKKDRDKDATGGLLQRIGSEGVLVIKDVTTILSMHRETRAAVLAALREVYDGLWERNLGSGGGKTLTWKGRLVVIGAVTTAWDSAHAVVSSMGDRFLLVRLDSTQHREEACDQALDNTGHEVQMRAELSEAVGRVIAGLKREVADISKADRDRIKRAANLVTLARTAVEFDYRGDVISAHAPEMPTRFAKQLLQVVRGARAIGIEDQASIALAIRCARDSMPPMRLAILEVVQREPGLDAAKIAKTLKLPAATVTRQLEALRALSLIEGTTLRTGIDPKAVSTSPEKSDYAVCGNKEEVYTPPDISGDATLPLDVPF